MLDWVDTRYKSRIESMKSLCDSVPVSLSPLSQS